MNTESRPTSAKTGEDFIPRFEVYQGNHILKIENLNELTNLTKLKLDNNIIEKIENLSALKNLKCLDLSFNRIECIENLDALVNLEDLSLSTNRLSKLEGLDRLKQLQYLALTNNDIDDLETVLYLRELPNLTSVSLKGNPLAKDPDYVPFIAAFFGQLVYLDYKRISPEMKESAYQQYQLSVDQLNEKYCLKQTELDDSEEMERQLKLQKDAFVDQIFEDRLYTLIVEADVDGAKFMTLPLVGEVHEQYRERLHDICHQIFEYGLEEYEKREVEEKQFRETILEAKELDRERGMKIVADLIAYKTKIFKDVEKTAETDSDAVDSILGAYKERLHEVWEELMSNESILSEQIDEVVKEFEQNLRDLVAYFTESVQNHLSKCRESATIFHERLTESTLPYAERLAKMDPVEAEQLLFPDRDTMNNCLAQSRDSQILRIDQCEESIIKRVRDWCDTLLNRCHQEELIQRHIDRITEINLFIDSHRTELECCELMSI